MAPGAGWGRRGQHDRPVRPCCDKSFCPLWLPAQHAVVAVAHGTDVARREEEGSRRMRGREPQQERIMFRTRHAAIFVPLFVSAITVAAFAATPPSGRANTPEKP